MAIETIKVPDIGGAEDVEVIELSVAEGDAIAKEESVVVLESDKASMDIPAPFTGKIVKYLVKEGDKVSEGSPLAEVEVESAGGEAQDKAPAKASDTSKASAPDKSKSAASGSREQSVAVPDIGGAENVDVIEICVKVGDEVQEGDSLIVLESDKASMDIPSPATGKVVRIELNEGDKASEGTAILVLASADGDTVAATQDEPDANAAAEPKSEGGGTQEIQVPDIGGAEDVDVIEVIVNEGDQVNEGDSLIVLESDKASMEVPSPVTGKLVSLAIKTGDKVSMGTVIGTFEVAGGAKPSSDAVTQNKAPSEPAPSSQKPAPAKASTPASSAVSSGSSPSAGADVYAGPAVRKLARQMAVDLREVKATGPRNRVLKDDVKAFVKTVMETRTQGGGTLTSGSGIPAVPAVDFAQFGEVERVKMSKIKKVTAEAMTRSWLNIPHVTQFDDVDITEMEAFRKDMKAEAEKAGVKLTPLPFLVKACAAALKAEPSFNVSMDADGQHIVHKHYVHIGVAVDTPNGLVVPVIRDADKKGLFDIANEAMALAKKAREGKLMPRDMQGGCFTISSLGAMGGTGFTPIVNSPETAILGVSRAETKPHWDGKAFVPRLKLPLSLSYDHRAINGGDAGRFFTYLNSVLMDIRRLLL